MTATIPASELIAALIASHGGVVSLFRSYWISTRLTHSQIDCHKVAALLNMTYWKVEGQLRKPKQEATALTDKAKNEGRLDANNAVIKSALPTGNQRPGNGATQSQ